MRKKIKIPKAKKSNLTFLKRIASNSGTGNKKNKLCLAKTAGIKRLWSKASLAGQSKNQRCPYKEINGQRNGLVTGKILSSAIKLILWEISP
jgi:hypothetical protein